MRKGLSYLEVLIAAGIALTGMLGAVALFPVAIRNLQSGQVTDTMAYVGPSALESVSAIHLDDPKWWLFNPGGGLTEVERDVAQPGYLPRADIQGRNWQASISPVDAFCFDPRFVASVGTWDNTQNDPTMFPAIPIQQVGDSRMRRATIAARNTGPFPRSPLAMAQARLLFKVQDDCIFNRDADETIPASQSFLTTLAGTQRRDYMADYETIVTAVPETSFFGGTFTATGEWDVSAVVLYRRTPMLDTIDAWNGDANFVEEERLCDVQFSGQGFNGGDVTIQTRAGRPQSDLAMHDHSIVLVHGAETVTFNQPGQPPVSALRPRFQWYRVSQYSTPYANGTRRDLTLDGPDWPLATTSVLRCSLYTGAVGVFSKRMRLQ